MRFIFRADASRLSGAGHVARLLAIAEESISRGIECIFIGEITEPEWLLRKFEELEIIYLPNSRVSSFPFLDSDILFIDSYSVKKSDPLICSKVWKKRILLADSSTPAYDADLVFYIENLPVPERFSSSQVHHGFKYFPLKKSITRVKSSSGRLKKLVVVGGGTDPYNFASEMSKILHSLEGFKTAVFVSEDVESIADLDSRFEVLSFGGNLDSQIDSSDLVFSTASTLALETLARGIPLGIACAVENQRTFYNYFASEKVAIAIGHRDVNQFWELNSTRIESMISDAARGIKIVQESGRVIDNLGSIRIVDIVLESCC
jgi:spore coat polysaccharide biosynthesis predicted glycosyltransferase SpsG